MYILREIGGKWKEKVELTKKKVITNFGGQSGTFFREMRFGKFDFSETGGMLHRLRGMDAPGVRPTRVWRIEFTVTAVAMDSI